MPRRAGAAARTLGDWTALVEWLKSDGEAAGPRRPAWEDFADRRRADAAHVFDVLAGWAAGLHGRGDRRGRRSCAACRSRRSGRSTRCPRIRSSWRAASSSRGARRAWRSSRCATTSPLPDGERLRVRAIRWICILTTDAECRFPAHPGPLPPGAGEERERRRARECAFRPRRHPRPRFHLGGRRAGRDPRARRSRRRRDQGRAARYAPDGPSAAAVCSAISIAASAASPSISSAARRRRAGAPTGERCDVVIDNFSPRVMANWGLDPAALRRLGPRHHRRQHVGLRRHRPDARPGELRSDAAGADGLHLAHAPSGRGSRRAGVSRTPTWRAATARRWRCWRRSGTAADGRGQAIDISQLEALAALLRPAARGAARRSMPRRRSATARRSGRRAARHLPLRAERDRWCAISVFTRGRVGALRARDRQPRRGRARSASRRSPSGSRMRRSSTPTSTHGPRAARPRRSWRALQAAGVAAGIVADARDLCRRDPQLAARGYFATIRTPEGNAVTHGRTERAALAHARRVPRRGPAPRASTRDEILRDLLELERVRSTGLRTTGIIA